jgi:putative addiction module killer protein
VWFDHLKAEAAAKVSVALTRLESGNFSNVKGVGGGVYEYRIDFGPGYRIYLGKDGDQLVILLTDGFCCSKSAFLGSGQHHSPRFHTYSIHISHCTVHPRILSVRWCHTSEGFLRVSA